MNKRFNHAISLSFSVDSNNDEPTAKEVLEILKKKVEELSEDNVLEEVEIFDTLDREE